MTLIPVAGPETIGIDPKQLAVAEDLLRRWVESGLIPSATLCVGRGTATAPLCRVGMQRLEAGSPPLRPDALFLVASISKPVTATAVMMLVERGLLALDDRVVDFVPAFGENNKQDVRIRHLLTHTSGLPDMLPNNRALREAHQPLSVFVDEICRVPLLFPPGMGVSYQSMGTAMLGEVVRVVAGQPLPTFLEVELFGPLGMADTSLGCRLADLDRVAAIRLPPDMAGSDWGWNSPYWLTFGAPWGGLITTATDLALFCRMMLGQGSVGGVRILSPASVRAMTTNQLSGMVQVPEADRRCRPWGLGWRLQWPGASANFGDLPGPRSFGHWGSTGTLCWIDPDADAFFVLLTTEPQDPEGRYLTAVSNAVAASLR